VNNRIEIPSNQLRCTTRPSFRSSNATCSCFSSFSHRGLLCHFDILVSTSSRIGFCAHHSHRPPSVFYPDNTLSSNPTVLHHLPLIRRVRWQRNPTRSTAIGRLRGRPWLLLNLTSERLLGARGVLAVGCMEACERIVVRSCTATVGDGSATKPS